MISPSSEVDAAVEPRLHRMAVGRGDIDWLRGHESAQMVVNDSFGDSVARAIAKQQPNGPCAACDCPAFTPEKQCDTPKCGHGKKAHRNGRCHDHGRIAIGVCGGGLAKIEPIGSAKVARIGLAMGP